MKPFGISKNGIDSDIMMEEGIPMTPPIRGGLGAGGGIGINPAANALPPIWVDDVDSVNGLLADITRSMGILTSMHATRIGTVFGKDLDDMEAKIQNVTESITDKFRQAEKALVRVGTATRRVGGEEATIGANVQRRYVCVFVPRILIC